MYTPKLFTFTVDSNLFCINIALLANLKYGAHYFLTYSLQCKTKDGCPVDHLGPPIFRNTQREHHTTNKLASISP